MVERFIPSGLGEPSANSMASSTSRLKSAVNSFFQAPTRGSGLQVVLHCGNRIARLPVLEFRRDHDTWRHRSPSDRTIDMFCTPAVLRHRRSVPDQLLRAYGVHGNHVISVERNARNSVRLSFDTHVLHGRLQSPPAQILRTRYSRSTKIMGSLWHASKIDCFVPESQTGRTLHPRVLQPRSAFVCIL